MIVCSCNVLTEVEIRASIATLNGPRRVCDVYASLGCAAKCGGCAGTIGALISEAEARDFGAERIKRGGEAKEELMRADAKVIDTLNPALKSELTAMPRAFGRSAHPPMQRWNWSGRETQRVCINHADRAKTTCCEAPAQISGRFSRPPVDQSPKNCARPPSARRF